MKRLGYGRRLVSAGSGYRNGVAGDWKNVFTKENRRQFGEKAGELLERLG
jgi:hypothetical protein